MPENYCFHVKPSGAPVLMPDLANAIAAAGGEGFVWFDFVNPTREELSALIEPFGVHPLSVEDCLDEDQVPKIEDFPTNTFLLLNAYEIQNKCLILKEVDFIIGKKFLISVNARECHDASSSRSLLEILNYDIASVTKGTDFLLYSIIDKLVDRKFTAVEKLQEEIDLSEERLLKDAASFRPEDLLQLRRDLLTLRKSLFHEREILIKICRRDSPYITEKSIYHFRDVYDHLAKFFEASEISREMITNLMEMYLSMINNHMAKVANKTNRTVRRLTLIATVFMPLTLLSGILGMSEWTMMTGADNWKIAYPSFFVFMIVLGILNYYILTWVESRARKKHKQKLEE
jgi:magnesium transporter